jgi:hypothetical protein
MTSSARDSFPFHSSFQGRTRAAFCMTAINEGPFIKRGKCSEFQWKIRLSHQG